MSAPAVEARATGAPAAGHVRTPARRWQRLAGVTGFLVLLVLGLAIALVVSAGSGQLPIPAD